MGFALLGSFRFLSKVDHIVLGGLSATVAVTLYFANEQMTKVILFLLLISFFLYVLWFYSKTRPTFEKSVLLDAAMSATSYKVMYADLNFKIKVVSPTLMALFREYETTFQKQLPSFSAAQVVGKTVDQFHPDMPHIAPMLSALTEPYHGEIRIGGLLLCLTVIPISLEGEKVGYMVEWADKTIEETLAKERHEHEQLLHQERLKTMGVMAASVAHEINNPIAGVLFNLAYLHEVVKDEEHLEVLQLCESEISRVGRIVQELLSFARHDKSQLRDGDAFDVLPAIKACEHIIQAQLLTHGVQLKVSVEDGLPMCLGNESHFQQILLNLMINALHALERVVGGVITIELSVQWSKNRMKVCVTDNGKGVPEDIREKIFNPFYTTKESGKGTGLGLSLAATMANDMNGFLKLDTTYSHGARFILYMPIDRGE